MRFPVNIQYGGGSLRHDVRLFLVANYGVYQWQIVATDIASRNASRTRARVFLLNARCERSRYGMNT